MWKTWSFYVGVSKSEVGNSRLQTSRRDHVLDHAKRKTHIDRLVKKALNVWGNASSESEKEKDNHKDVSMMVVEYNESVFNFIVSH